MQRDLKVGAGDSLFLFSFLAVQWISLLCWKWHTRQPTSQPAGLTYFYLEWSGRNWNWNWKEGKERRCCHTNGNGKGQTDSEVKANGGTKKERKKHKVPCNDGTLANLALIRNKKKGNRTPMTAFIYLTYDLAYLQCFQWFKICIAIGDVLSLCVPIIHLSIS